MLALGTWPEVFKEVLWTAFIDNSGALHALVHGTLLAPEANEIVGRPWLNVAAQQVALFSQRVESKANIADGPTRHDLSEVSKLGSTFLEPCMPAFIDKVWH